MSQSASVESPQSDREKTGEQAERSFESRLIELKDLLNQARSSPTVSFPMYKNALMDQAKKEKKLFYMGNQHIEWPGGYGKDLSTIFVKDTMPPALLEKLSNNQFINQDEYAQIHAHSAEWGQAERILGIYNIPRMFFVNEDVVNGIGDPEFKKYTEAMIGAALGNIENDSDNLERISATIDRINSVINDFFRNKGITLSGDVLKQIEVRQ